ncbi:MAG: DUF4446 family protein [Bacteroidaceae bacterium]|jgi:cell division protein FtsL|nr:DUF4446 family protein [Bacteroidaceae bacterium]
MNPITPWLVCVALLAMLIFAIYVAIKTSKKQNQEIKRLQSEVEAQKKISQELQQYIKEIAKINSDKEDVAQQIQEAKDDEEVLAIIAGLVKSNNDRVRK